MVNQNLEHIRRDYTSSPLLLSQLNSNPIAQLKAWMKEAKDSTILDPTAASLATTDQDGGPSNRIILVKEITSDRLIFYTNYASKKGQDLAKNPKASLLFYWDVQHRQIRISGTVSKVSKSKSEAYFQTRPIESQILASLSNQSTELDSKDELNAQFEAIKKTQSAPLPLPSNWGGYSLTPTSIEFWQGQNSRNHDRFIYTKQASNWTIKRIAP